MKSSTTGTRIASAVLATYTGAANALPSLEAGVRGVGALFTPGLIIGAVTIVVVIAGGMAWIGKLTVPMGIRILLGSVLAGGAATIGAWLYGLSGGAVV